MKPPSRTRRRRPQGIPAASPAMADPLSPSPKCHQDLTSVAPFSKKTTTKSVHNLKQSVIPGPAVWASDGGPAVPRALGMIRNPYVSLGSRKKMSALLAWPGFCWMVWNQSELPLVWLPLRFLLRLFGPFIWTSNPLQI